MNSRKGKTYEDIVGVEKAKEWKRKQSDRKYSKEHIKNFQKTWEEKRKKGYVSPLKNKSLEEILGNKQKVVEKIKKYKETCLKRFGGHVSPHIGKTYEEIMGVERAKERKRNISKATKGNSKPNVSKALTGRKRPDISNILKKKWQNLEFRKKQLEVFQNVQHTKIIYKNICFRSKGEVEWYKWFENLNILFMYEFLTDFTFFDKNNNPVLFMEHHPDNRWWKATPKNVKAYYKERRKLLDGNGFKCIPLIVTTDLSEETKNKVRELVRR